MTLSRQLCLLTIGLAVHSVGGTERVHTSATGRARPAPYPAATLWVTQLGGSGPGSLREVLATANTRAGIDHIRFARGLEGPVPVADGPLVIRDDVHIDGAGGQRIRLHGNGLDSLIEVAASGVEVALRGLVLTNAGDSAIVNRGANLFVEDCTLRANYGRRGGAIASYGGALSLTRTTLRDNFAETFGGDDEGLGGGLYAIDTTVHLEASRISSNYAEALGGGLYVELADPNLLFVRGSLIDANIAVTQGGGAFVHARSGPNSGFLNSTLSGNRSARDAALWFDGGLVLNNSTISNNVSVFAETPGICPGLCGAGDRTELWLNSTLVSGNRDAHGNGYDLAPMAGPVHVAHSLIERVADNAIDDDRGGNRLNINPRLGPLAEHGGSLPVHALAADSPAIDAGANPSLLQYDQRGPRHARVIGAAPDIGAYEFTPAPAPSPATCRWMRCWPEQRPG